MKVELKGKTFKQVTLTAFHPSQRTLR